MNSGSDKTATAALGLGGNMGDRTAFLVRAVDGLGTHPSIDVTAISAIYETPPWGKTDQPAFLNAAALIRTALPPRALLETILGVERKLGRVRGELWGPRNIDIDILLFGNRTVDEPGLTIPHPRIQDRAFVLRPLADILPDAVVAGRSVLEWLTVIDMDGISRSEETEWYPYRLQPSV